MLKNKSSVVIINTDGTANKNILVPTVILHHWKKILLSLFTVVVCACAAIVYFSTSKTEEELAATYQTNLQKVQEANRKLSANQSSNEKDLEEAKKSFNKLDSTIESINQKMKKRGLQTLKISNVGGPIEDDNADIEALTAYYESTLKELDRKLEGIPFGVPHKGRITSKFGYRRNPFTNRGRELHSGVDIKGRVGDLVKATAAGSIAFAGYEGNYGYVVKVKHANGFETRYAHLTRTSVKKGQRVDAGQLIGLLGNTGRSTGPHLHYEVLHKNTKVNPEKFFTF